MMRLGWIGCLGALAALALGCLGPTAGSLGNGSAAPEIEGIDSHEKGFKLSDYRGKVVLLDFWRHN
jgi:hypothetical protein